MAGGVALNCVANGKIVESGLFQGLFIQPAAGDAGGALGAAYATHHLLCGKQKAPQAGTGDAMGGALLGPSLSRSDIERMARKHGAVFQCYAQEDLLMDRVADLLDKGKVVGWVQGRMEFGPRALGNRSILGDPRDPGMQRRMNLSIKNRESFRPFAPAVLAEDASEHFDLDTPSPYMLLVRPVHKDRQIHDTLTEELDLQGRLGLVRSHIPAVTHVDMTARIQTVHRDTNPRFHALLTAFKRITGCPVLINTSFNVRAEPIVLSAEDAYRCFMTTDIDHLVIGDHLFAKEDQPAWRGSDRSVPVPLD
jgi:carbamoyltransferase